MALDAVDEINTSLRRDVRGRHPDPPETVTPRLDRRRLWETLDEAQGTFITAARRSLQDDGVRRVRRAPQPECQSEQD